MQIRLVKEGPYLAPFDSESEAWIEGRTDGDYFHAEITAPRNLEFHKKFFALLNAAYPHWNPEPLSNKHGVVEKSFEQFREDVTILAGFYEQRFRLDGTTRIVAKSIAFGKMDDVEFHNVYNQVVNVIIRKVLVGWTIEQVDELVGGFL